MSRIKVTSTVNVYEINGEDCADPAEKPLRVDSHWNRREFLVLDFCGKRITVARRDLDAAIENAVNTGGP